MNLLPAITDLPVADIIVGPRLRPFSEAEVAALVGLIEEFGQTTPILVRKTKGGFELVDGLHRLEATRRAGLPTIPVRAYATMSDADARLLEASQNLTGGLSPLDDAVFLAAWKREHLKKHPETAQGKAGAMARHGLQRTSKSFAEIVAAKRAIGAHQIRRIIAAGEALRPADLALLRTATAPITLKDVEALGKVADDDERARIASLLSCGNAKSVSAARRQIVAEDPGAAEVETDPSDRQYLALKTAWSRAGAAARRRWLAEVGADLADLMPRPEVAAE